MFFNSKTGMWEPMTQVSADEFWAMLSKGRATSMYEDGDKLFNIECELNEMDSFPDAEAIIARMKKDVE